MKMQTYKEREAIAHEKLAKDFGYSNPMQAPRVDKVVVSVGVGSVKDKGRVALIVDRLAKITGQKPAPRGAKKSIATFKLRQGDIVGYQVTLRGLRAQSFLEKLFSVVLPRTRDFRGIGRASVDAMGNITIGIKEHTIFPETSDEDIKDVFGLAITITTVAKSRDEALLYFECMGAPFQSAQSAGRED